MSRTILTLGALAILILTGAVALSGAIQTGNERTPKDLATDGARQLLVQPLPSGQREVRPIPVRPDAEPRIPRPDPRAPVLAEIREVVAREKAALAELRGQFEAAATDAGAAELITQIGAVKRGTRLEILHIQLRHARAQGYDSQAQRIEHAIARILNPPVPPPAYRPPPAIR